MSYCEEDLHPEAKKLLSYLLNKFSGNTRTIGFCIEMHHFAERNKALIELGVQPEADLYRAYEIVYERKQTYLLLTGG